MRKPFIYTGIALMAVFGLAACGSKSSSTSTTSSTEATSTTAAAAGSSASATIYIDEIPGKTNGQDDALKDQFWWANTSTDTNPVTSFNVNVAAGGTLKVVSQADDPMKVTITGPNGYSESPIIDAGPNTSTSITLPTTTGSYTIISDPTTPPTRPGARGGVVHVS